LIVFFGLISELFSMTDATLTPLLVFFIYLLSHPHHHHYLFLIALPLLIEFYSLLASQYSKLPNISLSIPQLFTLWSRTSVMLFLLP
jgi:hypothetical protein